MLIQQFPSVSAVHVLIESDAKTHRTPKALRAERGKAMNRFREDLGVRTRPRVAFRARDPSQRRKIEKSDNSKLRTMLRMMQVTMGK